jgi:5-methylcytosine-specific restriction enzyme subunit McrC
MLSLTVLERGRIERDKDLAPNAPREQFGTPDRLRLPAVLFDRLWNAEGVRVDRGEKPIFTLGRHRATVGPWVGVLQIPGLQLEILPKIEKSQQVSPAGNANEQADTRLGRDNLLCMLELAGLTSFRSRGLASLRTRRGTVNDQLLTQFLSRVIEELHRGFDRNYFDEENNLLTKRGRLLLKKQITINSAQSHRFFCRYDTFGEHTQINRVLRTACDRLARWNLPVSLQHDVGHALAILDGVEPIHDAASLPGLNFTRQNDRFRDIYDFALLILNGQAPDLRSGNSQTFSLLFDMDKVFERFISAFIKRYVLSDQHFGFLGKLTLHAQATSNQRYLFDPHQHNSARGALELKPDLLFKDVSDAANPRFLVGDTKWKVLETNSGGKPSRDDFFQLYAYLRRFGCSHAFLLYPQASGSARHEFHALDNEGFRVGCLRTAFVDLSIALDSAPGRARLAQELATILQDALKAPERAPHLPGAV